MKKVWTQAHKQPPLKGFYYNKLLIAKLERDLVLKILLESEDVKVVEKGASRRSTCTRRKSTMTPTLKSHLLFLQPQVTKTNSTCM